MLMTHMQKVFQLQSLASKLCSQYAKDSEWTLDCLNIEQDMKKVLKELKQQKLPYPQYL